MRRIKTAFLYLIILQAFVSFANAGDTEKNTCTGKVIGAQGEAVEGATVSFYEMVYGGTTYSFDVKLREEVATKADGRFTFINEKPPGIYSMGIILAQKQGLAIGWINWQMREDEDFEIELTESKELSGLVVDENDTPVTEAQVRIYMLVMGDEQDPRHITTKASLKFFTTKTDSDGKFVFGQIPAGATAEFLVSKAGKATVCTWTTGSFPLSYTAGQGDIKIVLPIEARIEGVVVEKGSDKAVAGVQLMPTHERNPSVFGQEPITSNVDGAFTIDALTAGKNVLGLVTTRDGLAEWVAETVEVTNEAGKTKSGVKIEVCKGGVLEVMITDSREKEPVGKASISIRQKKTNRWFHIISDENGLAQIRLFPGRYHIQGVYKEGYAGNQEQKDFTIEENKTHRLEFQLEPPRKISGIVLDTTGKPVEGATLRILPGGRRGETKSDAKGKFEVTRDRQGRRQDETIYLVIRHIEKNLAAALEIEEDTKSLDVKLMPGIVFAGKVVDTEGKALAGAKINVMLRASNWGSPITDWQRGGAVTDTEGRFEVKAMPPEHKYNVQTSAEGYGKDQIQVLADDAVDNRLDVGQFTLALANLSVSGLVVDADGKPVSGARISAHGYKQPDRRNIQTDAQGRFTIDKVCAGQINLSVNSEGKERLYGNIETEGGASDVKVVITPSGSSRRSRSAGRQIPSLAGKDLPALTGLNLQIDPNEIAGKVILVCFWDMEQRPSRHCVRELAKKAGLLKDKGVVVLAVHASRVDENVLNEWVRKNGIGFAVGMIEAEEENTRFKWGVKGLPWLILTNAEHIVQAEGFGIAELDENIGEALEQKSAVQVEGEDKKVEQKNRGTGELLEEAKTVLTKFQQALKASEWNKALSLCSEVVQSEAKKYKSAEIFFEEVVPVEQIISVSNVQTSGGKFGRDNIRLAYFCFLRLSEPDARPTINWGWRLNKTDSGWVVDFKNIPLGSWIEQETLRLNREHEKAKERVRTLQEGLRLSLVPLSDGFVIGQPMLFRLGMTNVSGSPIVYIKTSFSMFNNPITVIAPDGKRLEYLSSSVQTALGPPVNIEPNQTVVLAEKYDVTTQYHITQPGQYTFQFTGHWILALKSNIVRMDVKSGQLSELDNVVEKLRTIFPNDWTLTRTRIRDIADLDLETDRGVIVNMVGKRGKKGTSGGTIGVFVLINPSQSFLEITENEADLWGQSQWGPVYVQSLNAEQLWPNYEEQIIKALSIQKLAEKPAVQVEGEG